MVRIRDLSAIRIDRVEFESAGGTVRGLVYHIGRPATCLVLCHGYSAGKHNLDLLAFHLATEGFGSLAFDFLGHKLGASTGPLRKGEDLIANALDAVACAQRLDGVRRIVIAGHSMGAAAAIGAAVLSPAVDGVIAMATSDDRSRNLSENALLSGLHNRANYVEGASPEELTAAMDGCTARIAEIAPRPLLVIAAKRDALVAPSAVRRLFDRAKDPKTFELIDATHTDCADRAKFAVVRWLKANGF